MHIGRVAERAAPPTEAVSASGTASSLEAARWQRIHRTLAGIHRARVVRFAAIGASGILVNSFGLFALTDGLGLHYLLSMVIASQVSTTWNFSLVEMLVFPGRSAGRAMLARFVRFDLVNMSTLVIRAPLVALAVEVAGIHYLAANVAVLVALFLGRYLAADRWIWRVPVSMVEAIEDIPASEVEAAAVAAEGVEAAA